MVTSLFGWVEVQENELWSSVLTAGTILCGDYDLYGALFGVRNYAQFEALFGGRGLPDDVSETVQSEYEACPEEFYGATWVTHLELEAVDPNTRAMGPDERVTEWLVEPSGNEVLVRKASWSSQAEADGVYATFSADPTAEVRIADRVYRRSVMTVGEALGNSSFARLRRIMQALAQEYGSENMRLVVWFAD